MPPAMPRRAAALLAATFAALALPAVRAASSAAGSEPMTAQSAAAPTVELTAAQLGAIRIAALGEYVFAYRRQAVGSIDFDGDLAVQVYPPYPGRIARTYADLGDRVLKGAVLFTLESPDFIAAESNLIAAAATYDQSTSLEQRAVALYAAHGMDQNDYETAVANQKAAEGALRAARNALLVFGKTPAEIDALIARRQVESALVVRSPITGRVTAREAAPGTLVQPGTPPAPFQVADLRSKWMVAEVVEGDSPLMRVGQPIEAAVSALPGRTFHGRITRLGRSLDPNTHRITVRCTLADPAEELIPGMLASFAITVQQPLRSLAIPMNGVVRNGDGTFAAWVTTDRRHFTERLVKVGEPLDGEYPVLAGLARGELVVVDGAVFVSNILFAPPSD